MRSTRADIVLLPTTVARDAGRAAAAPLLPLSVGVGDGALAAAVAWLRRSHDATGRQGSSKGFSLRHGWLPAYPETTGYVLGTLLEYARRTGEDGDLVDRAREMGDWEREIQEPDGGIMQGHVETRPRRSIVFNTGMVLHGWVDLVQAGYGGFEEAADRACGFLVDNLRGDGTWSPEFEYGGIPHVYNTRVAWAMLRWARHAGRSDAEAAARSQLDWACSRQLANGWFDDCVFRDGMTPSTHAVAYTLRGLLESHVLSGEQRWLSAVELTADALLARIDQPGLLPANFDSDWRAVVGYSCLTGTAQLGIVLLRLFQETGERRWFHAGLKAVEQAAGRQEAGDAAAIGGALAGSFPIWGRYAPLQYPNWATKFLADALMLYDDCLIGAGKGVDSVTPGSTRPLAS